MSSVPFTPEQFLDGFGRFNTAFWPLHLVAIAIAAAVLGLALHGGARASRAAALGLAALWIPAAALQGIGMRPVMSAAVPVALLFLLEGVLLAVAGLRDRLAFRVQRGASAALGLALVVYAFVVYPAVGVLSGEAWPRLPVPGSAPCPNTIFTLGLLLLTERPVPRGVLVIPFLWSLVGIPAAMVLGVVQDWGLPVAGLLATGVIATRDRGWRAHRLA